MIRWITMIAVLAAAPALLVDLRVRSASNRTATGILYAMEVPYSPLDERL